MPALMSGSRTPARSTCVTLRSLLRGIEADDTRRTEPVSGTRPARRSTGSWRGGVAQFRWTGSARRCCCSRACTSHPNRAGARTPFRARRLAANPIASHACGPASLVHSRARPRRGAARLTRLSIFAAAREAPNRIALITETTCFTYSELAARTLFRAAAPAQLRGPVLLQPQLDVDSLLWLYAASATGTPFVPLHASATTCERAAAHALTGVRNPPLPDLVAIPLVIDREIEPESPYSLMLTSGSLDSSCPDPS